MLHQPNLPVMTHLAMLSKLFLGNLLGIVTAGFIQAGHIY